MMNALRAGIAARFAAAGFLLIMAMNCGTGTASPSSGISSPPPSSPEPQISSPANNSSVTSPFALAVETSSSFAYMNVAADNTVLLRTSYPSLPQTWIYLPNGTHNLVLTTYDVSNHPLYQSSLTVNVTAQSPQGAISSIQARPNWQWCTALLNGSPCASGVGNATTALLQNVHSPSRSGNASEFQIGGPVGYSNSLWWNSIGGGQFLNHLSYSTDFYISDGTLPEALEFDINQSLDNLRYTYGTECSFLNTRQWDVWDPEGERWVETGVPCDQLSSKSWHHLEWQFERVNNQVHYISLTLDGVTTPVDLRFNAQQGWPYADIDLAFQMDGNSVQSPYSVWLDNLTMTGTF